MNLNISQSLLNTISRALVTTGEAQAHAELESLVDDAALRHLDEQRARIMARRNENRAAARAAASAAPVTSTKPHPFTVLNAERKAAKMARRAAARAATVGDSVREEAVAA